jgi:hypothetical protein
MVKTDLTYDKIQKMSASEARAAQLRDPKGWRLAFARERRSENKRHAPIWNARRMGTGHRIDNKLQTNLLDGHPPLQEPKPRR